MPLSANPAAPLGFDMIRRRGTKDRKQRFPPLVLTSSAQALD